MAEKKVAAAKEYDETNVRNLSGLQAVRKKASMYIGDTDNNGVWTIIREAADNTVDEALAGRNSVCYIALDEHDKMIYVADNGQGIPVKSIDVEDPVTHKIHKVPAFKAAVSLLHTGGKFDDKAYATSRGTHGVGIKATNALSTVFEAYTFYKEQWYSIKYAKGKLTQEMEKCKAPPKLPNGKVPKRGTVICFTPDSSLFQTTGTVRTNILPMAMEWAKLSAYLVPKFRVILEYDGKSKEFYFENGYLDYLKDQVKKLACTELNPAKFHYSSDLVDVALTFTDYDGKGVGCYTNGLLQSGGGTHARSIQAALFKSLEKYMVRGRNNFDEGSLIEGVVGFVNVKLSTPKFGGQTKDKLTDDRAGVVLRDSIIKELTAFWAKNKELAKTLCERAAKLEELKAGFKASKNVLKELKSVRQNGMPSKFSGCPKAKPEDRELFIVEGDSAGGTAKKARDFTYQEVLPLKGKIQNAIRNPEASLDSDEVIYVLSALGFNPELKAPADNLRVGKVILLCDPDFDGYHINALCLSLFYQHIPKLFDKGMVYVVEAPEYYGVNKEGVVKTGFTAEECAKQLPKNAEVNHIKGWGEISAELLEQMAFGPKTRTLIKVGVIDSKGKKEFIALMGDDVAARKELVGI